MYYLLLPYAQSLILNSFFLTVNTPVLMWGRAATWKAADQNESCICVTEDHFDQTRSRTRSHQELRCVFGAWSYGQLNLEYSQCRSLKKTCELTNDIFPGWDRKCQTHKHLTETDEHTNTAVNGSTVWHLLIPQQQRMWFIKCTVLRIT